MDDTTATSNINSFPNELLDKIFAYVGGKKQIRLVCKSWCKVAGDITRYAYFEDEIKNFGYVLQDYPDLACKSNINRSNPTYVGKLN